jgi:hypothetical protein
MPKIQDVIDNCGEYINILRKGEKGCFLIRGVHNDNIDIEYRELSIAYRKPRNMPLQYHNAMNKHFEKTIGWPVRNGLFSFGVKTNYSKLNDLGYGTSYLLFPCGHFQYVYDPEKFDLYGSLNDFINNGKSDSPINSFIDSINYLTDDINNAMSKIVSDFRSVEIIINCDNYYLINMKYVSKLIKLIWE